MDENTKFGIPDLGKSTAVNAAKKMKLWNFNGATEAFAQLLKYACSYFVVEEDQMVDNFKTHHKQSCIKLIQSVMTDYYTQTDPAIAEDVFNSLLSILKNSARAYSLLCELYKLQNMRNYKDEDDIKLAGLLGNWSFAELTDAFYNANNQRYVATVDVNAGGNSGFGAFSISNAQWQNEFLQALQNIYLNDSIRQNLEFTFANTFKFRRDDATVRFAHLIPYQIQHNIQPSEATQYSSWKNLLDVFTNTIVQEINKYPYMTTILDIIGLNSGTKFDFTRDLKGQTLTIYDDFYGDLETALYSITIADHETMQLPIDDSDCIISEPEFTAHFKDNELKYSDRVSFDVISWTNLVRGSIYALTLHVIEISKIRSNDTVSRSLVIAPLYGAMLVDSNAPADAAKTAALLSASFYALMTDAVYGCYTAVMSYVDKQWKPDISVVLGMADYVFNTGDYEPILSQASYNLVFSNTSSEYLRGYLTNTIKTKQ